MDCSTWAVCHILRHPAALREFFDGIDNGDLYDVVSVTPSSQEPSHMRISSLATIIAVSAICALPALAQNTNDAKTNQPPSKQPTQGLPPSMSNPQYGNPGTNAQKQQTQGVPTSLSNPQYTGGAQKQ
jgi:hypothetical protein